MIQGKLLLGEKLPSTRELALQYQINPNTAVRIYKEMEQQNMCFTKRGLGTFVTEESAVVTAMREAMARIARRICPRNERLRIYQRRTAESNIRTVWKNVKSKHK